MNSTDHDLYLAALIISKRPILVHHLYIHLITLTRALENTLKGVMIVAKVQNLWTKLKKLSLT